MVNSISTLRSGCDNFYPTQELIWILCLGKAVGTARHAAYAISRPGFSLCPTSKANFHSQTRQGEVSGAILPIQQPCFRPLFSFASCHSFVSLYLVIVGPRASSLRLAYLDPCVARRFGKRRQVDQSYLRQTYLIYGGCQAPKCWWKGSGCNAKYRALWSHVFGDCSGGSHWGPVSPCRCKAIAPSFQCLR